jgi:bacteriophage N4 adsorption protein B
MVGDPIFWAAALVRELALFAAAGFLIGGIDDLIVDLIWLGSSGWRSLLVYRRRPRATAATLPVPREAGRLVVFVPAWSEEEVIGQTIGAALERLRHPDWRLYVGCYPNDPATIAAATGAAGADPHVRLVVGERPGPTNKADCLNTLWRALLADEARDGAPVKAVILHDAEDAVHADELRLYDSLIERFDMVQIPVHAEVMRGRGLWAALVSGHYCGEFAEAHAKQVVVREAVGAAVPSAGVGTAIRRAMLARIVEQPSGPFDGDSVTEDYELGLKIGAVGGRGAFVRLLAADGQGMVAVHACFPHHFVASARQKARWTAGIALAGWDRLGWRGGLTERWMRMRDRRAPLAAFLLAAAYVALVGWALVGVAALLTGRPVTIRLPAWLIVANLVLLGWRFAMRAWLVGRSHGVAMAMLTPLHMLIGNLVAMAAAVRALWLYVELLRHGRLRWDKTEHVLPIDPTA